MATGSLIAKFHYL